MRREIGELLFRILQAENIDLSAVTITHVVTSQNLRQARVLVSIREHHGERDRMLNLLRRHRTEIQARINEDLKLKYTPRLSFELDTSVERGDHVLALLAKMDHETAPEPPGPVNT